MLLIHHTTLEKLRASHGDTWFDRLRVAPTSNPDDRGGLLGEDLSFCLRVRQSGNPVWVNTAIKTTHSKIHWIGESGYHEARILGAVSSAARALTEAGIEPTPEAIATTIRPAQG